ncbi:hypothetical protein BYT27DRAFT_7334193 [Phlegmacium glaucopus]|nr:hypothetical protein BYT27DRAFT_7334193 [Phlegmacium glaucopus]
MKLSVRDFFIIGLCLEGFFYGVYSGIFAIYLQDHWTSNKGTYKRNVIFYALCALYMLSVVNVVVDITDLIIFSNPTVFLHISFVQGIVSGCCDFIAQSILIYRCWIVWGCNIRVVILPSILAFVFLAMWLAASGSEYVVSDQIVLHDWGIWLYVASVALSMTVNALVTGLIVWKIFKVYREVKSAESDDWQTLRVTGGSKILTVIFMLIESGMILFSIQLARLVVGVVPTDTADAYEIIAPIHQMLNGITPTIIFVRLSMRLSFYDKESMIESSVGSLRFADNNPNPNPETGDVDIVDGDDDIRVRLSDDIEVVDR